MSKTDPDLRPRTLVWVRVFISKTLSPFEPQIIFDDDYAGPKLDIVKSYPLRTDEFDLSLGVLSRLYPAPEVFG